MPYIASKDNSVDVLHVVRDLDGSVHTGSLSSFTVTLLDESQNSQPSAVTWSEPLTGGYLTLTVTPDAVGNWLLSVTDPSGTAEATSDYQIQTVLDATGLSPSGTFLTTLANLKERLDIATSDTSSDDYLTNLIGRASHTIEAKVGRSLVQQTYTEYYDGDGSEWINLRQGPLQSITGVATATYDGGTTTTDAVTAGTYLGYGLDSEGWKLPGKLRANYWSWTPGIRNFEVVYVAGFSTVPYDLEQICLDLCVYHRNRRKDAATTSRDIGSGAIGFGGWSELGEIMRRLEPYIDRRLM